MATVLVVRHGETPWTRAGRVQGWAAVPLTDRGREQARAAGAYVAAEYGPVDRVVASDLRRAVESAEAVRAALGGPVDVVERQAWRERDQGVYQGFSHERYREAYESRRPASPVARALDAPEGGESWRDVETRVLSAWARLERELTDETVVVVTHTGPIWCVLRALNGGTLRATREAWDVVEGSVTAVSVTDAGSEVMEANVDPLSATDAV